MFLKVNIHKYTDGPTIIYIIYAALQNVVKIMLNVCAFQDLETATTAVNYENKVMLISILI